MLESSVVSAFAKRFFGYGNPSAPLWFIGLEEACRPREAEIQRRLDTWTSFGQPVWMDAREFHLRAGMGDLFDEANCKLQPTWKALIRICLKVEQPNAVTTTRALQNVDFHAELTHRHR